MFTKEKVLAIFIAIVLLTVSLPILTNATSDFEISNGVLTKYTGTGGTANIPEGVTSIGYDAFDNSEITKIIFPSSIKEIDGYAFNGCRNLGSVTIPNSVNNIGEWAFSGCLSMKEFIIGDNVKSIGDFGFAYCSNLEKITLGNSVESVGESALLSCTELKQIIATQGNKNFTSVDGILFSKDKSEIINYPNGKTETSYTIPNYVKSVGSTAFNFCKNLSSITTSKNHPYFISIDGVLYNKAKTELVRYPEGKYGYEFIIPSQVTKIGDSAFAFCANLNKITIPKNLINIGYMSFFYTTGLEEIVIPDKVKSIGDRSFYRTSAKNVLFGKSLISIGKEAFWDCEHIESVTFDDGLKYIGDGAFCGCGGIKEIALPNKLETIGPSAFESVGIKNLLIPDSVVAIGNNAFDYCLGLENVIIGNGLTHLNDGVFLQCRGLTKITFGNHLESIGVAVFECCALIEVIVPNSVTSIGDYAFFKCYDMKNIIISNSVISIGQGAFHGTADTNGFVSEVVPLPNLIINCTDNSFIHAFPQTYPYRMNEGLKYKIISETEMDKIQEEEKQNVQQQIDQAYIQTYASSSVKVDLQNAIKIGLKTQSMTRDNYKKKVTREDFCEIIMKLYDLLGGKEIVNRNNPFTDTTKSETIRAYSAGIVTANGKLFTPNAELTREQLCVMLVTSIEKAGIKLDESIKYKKSYKDINKVSSCAKDQVRILNGYDIFTCTGENLNPQGTVTKEEVLVTLYKAFKRFT